ncbi:hypothetical protein DRQ53_11145 [bacterium]|nr:MAG: hypothetical protein DRQ53_11145 [bacterium]
MELRYLTDADRPAIHATVLRAFADYEAPVDFDRPRLERLMARRSTDLTASVGAFEKGEMVAVMATAVREFEGVSSAYDVFTGVIDEYRGRGLAGQLFDKARHLLVGRGVHRFILEVIRSNDSAIRAYERAGFATRRLLRCYEISAHELLDTPDPEGVRLQIAAGPPATDYRSWRSWGPSWQNSDDSIDQTVEEVCWIHACVGEECVGYAVLVPVARDLPQLVVREDWRRRGIGRALLRAATARIEPDQPLRVINVDEASGPDNTLFARFAARELPPQHEMELDFEA